jgi:hypothetical protein
MLLAQFCLHEMMVLELVLRRTLSDTGVSQSATFGAQHMPLLLVELGKQKALAHFGNNRSHELF